MKRTSSSSLLHSCLPALLLTCTASGLAQAQGLPQMEDPSRSSGDGIITRLRDYGYDIVMLIALILVAAMFVGACYHAYTTYSEVQTGRKTWGDFGLTLGVGGALLVVGIWLTTLATDIL